LEILSPNCLTQASLTCLTQVILTCLTQASPTCQRGDNYIWGFPSVTAFEVPGSFVSGSCLKPLNNFERGREQAAFTFINDNQVFRLRNLANSI